MSRASQVANRRWKNLSVWRFLRAFIQHPRHVASVVPSSSALLSQLQDIECLRGATSVVELGPGTGETTQVLLEALSAEARLISIELVPEFVSHLQETLLDPRLQIVQDNALNLLKIAGCYSESAPDAVISGVPFSHLSVEQAGSLVRSIHACLKPGGTFVAYQFRHDVREYADELFGLPQVISVPLNVPPLSIFTWSKTESILSAPPRCECSLSRKRGEIENHKSRDIR
ncbi:MAG: methyltransferase domain-containing protein [Planctomycetaceae bacterium]|nr:methyltransferase domain-containing protein [Planctomycetaceae bacterium]